MANRSSKMTFSKLSLDESTFSPKKDLDLITRQYFVLNDLKFFVHSIQRAGMLGSKQGFEPSLRRWQILRKWLMDTDPAVWASLMVNRKLIKPMDKYPSDICVQLVQSSTKVCRLVRTPTYLTHGPGRRELLNHSVQSIALLIQKIVTLSKHQNLFPYWKILGFYYPSFQLWNYFNLGQNWGASCKWSSLPGRWTCLACPQRRICCSWTTPWWWKSNTWRKSQSPAGL